WNFKFIWDLEFGVWNLEFQKGDTNYFCALAYAGAQKIDHVPFLTQNHFLRLGVYRSAKNRSCPLFGHEPFFAPWCMQERKK
ncbi:MAG TPA: hypothetical protein PLZ86_04705, partial [bacterium]|nr:hypothetical protein [bacterium]